MNRSQADINKSVDMIAARRREREYFATSPDYGHLASKMGSEYLAKLLSKVHFLFLIYNSPWLDFWRTSRNMFHIVAQHLENVIRARIPSITSLINKSIEELEAEMDHLGRPIAVDAGVGFLHPSPDFILYFLLVGADSFYPGPIIHHLRTLPCF